MIRPAPKKKSNPPTMTATVRRKHEVEQALACANSLLVQCVKCSHCTRALYEVKHLISELNAVRFDMLSDLDYDQTQRVSDIELRIRSLIPSRTAIYKPDADRHPADQ